MYQHVSIEKIELDVKANFGRELKTLASAVLGVAQLHKWVIQVHMI